MNETVAKTMAYGGGGGAFLFGLDANTIGMIGGLIIGVVGLLLTWYYQRRRDKREQAEYDFRMGKR